MQCLCVCLCVIIMAEKKTVKETFCVKLCSIRYVVLVTHIEKQSATFGLSQRAVLVMSLTVYSPMMLIVPVLCSGGQLAYVPVPFYAPPKRSLTGVLVSL